MKTQWDKLAVDQCDVISDKHVESLDKIRVASSKGERMMVALRGALMVGCGLLLPSLLSGCDSIQRKVQTQPVVHQLTLQSPAQILPPQRRPRKCHMQAFNTRHTQRVSKGATDAEILLPSRTSASRLRARSAPMAGAPCGCRRLREVPS